MITREMEIKVGDVLIGRPLGMSCGCPVTHCGVATQVNRRTGVISWCVTGPLGPRQHGYKDLGYYIAEGYEGLVHETRCELKVGMRHYFQPRMCMLQWRHSGLINYLSRQGKSYPGAAGRLVDRIGAGTARNELKKQIYIVTKPLAGRGTTRRKRRCRCG